MVHLRVRAAALGATEETAEQLLSHIAAPVRPRYVVQGEMYLRAVPEVLVHDAEFRAAGACTAGRARFDGHVVAVALALRA